MGADTLARTVTRLVADEAADADLVRRYVAARDEAAFALLVRRHGPLVFGVCRRTLGHTQDAEDAFQAVFLVLARKAHAVRPDGVGRWLYGVAVRVANKARVRRARRIGTAAELPDVPAPPARPPLDWLPLLDAALARLPDRERHPILLCDLLGRSRAEAAAELGIAEGTLSSRLARARDRLRVRLARLGTALSVPTLAAGLSDQANGTVPPLLLESAIAVGSSAGAARELADGVLRTMLLAKVLKLSALGVCAIGMAAAAVAWLPTAGADPTGGQKEAPRGSPPAKEAPKSDSDQARIQGTWVIESAKAAPEVRPAGRGGFNDRTWDRTAGMLMTFSGDRVEFAYFPGRVRLFRLDPDRDPKRLDFTFRDLITGGGRNRAVDSTLSCIYKFDGDRLRVVIGDPDLGERPDSFEWSGPRSPFVHLTLRRPTPDERYQQDQFEVNQLEGTWHGLLETVKGQERAAPEGQQLVVKGDRLRFDTTGSDPLHATFTVDLAASPWHIDLSVTADGGGFKKGGKVAGIFSRSGEFLTLALGSPDRPSSFVEAGKEGTLYVLYTQRSSPRQAMELLRPGGPSPPPETPKKAAPPANDRIRKLQEERVKLLGTHVELLMERVRTGKEPLGSVTGAMRELCEAELELAGTQEAKVAALTKLLKHLQMIEDQLKALQETGLETKGGVMHATAARLKAEIELERLKAGQ